MADMELSAATKQTVKGKSKKRKTTESAENSTDESASPAKKVAKTRFTEIEFKVGLRDSNTRFTVLDRFVEEAANFPASSDYDIIEGYCRSSPECIEVLSLLEGEKRKPKELCSIFEVLESILVNVTGRLSKYKHVSAAIVKRVLSSHLGTLFFLLQNQNKTQHIKAGIKLLSAMVMQGDNAPRDILKQVDFQHKAFPTLLNRRDIKDPMDVRTYTLHFMLSFLIVGDKDVLTQILETKGFLNSIFPGLYADKLNTLQMVLPTLREKVVQNPEVSKTLKVRLMNQTTLSHLSKLYRWSGPKRFKKGDDQTDNMVTEEQDSESVKREDQLTVVDMVHRLLMDLCCDFKLGINFFDKSYGTSGKSLNHVLTGFLKSLHQPFTSGHLSELVIGVLKACPDQLVWYLPELKSALTPRATNKWIAAIHLLHKVYTDQPLVAPCMSLRDRVPLNKLVTMTMATIIPPKEVWTQVLAAIRHKDAVVQHEGLSFLLIVLKRIKATLDFTNQENHVYTASELDTLASLFKDAMVKACPDLATMLNCWSRAVKSVGGGETMNQSKDEEDKDSDDHMDVDDVVAKGFPQIASADLMLTILKTLCEYQAVFPEIFTENFVNFSSLLEGVRTVAANDNTSSHQVSLVQLHLLRLLAESNLRQITWLKESFSGRSTLYLLLEMVVFTHSNPKMVSVATNLLQKLLVSTGVFQHTEDELLTWLQQLVLAAAEENQHTVLPFVEKVFSAVLKDPFSFTEKVTEVVAEAGAIDAGSSGAEVGSATTTSDHIIDTILSMDEVELDTEEEPGQQSQHQDESDLASRFPFSALVPASLKLWKEEMENKDDSESAGVKKYLCGVVHSVLHQQTDPVPLCLMLQQKNALWLDPSCARWLETTPTTKGKSKKKGTRVNQADMTTLSDLLTAKFNAGVEDVISNESQTQITEVCQNLSADEGEAAVKTILLYMRTHALCALQDDRNLEAVKIYLELLSEILQTILKPQVVDEVTEDDQKEETIDHFDSLLIQRKTNIDTFKTMMILIAKHPELEQWFLWKKSLGTKGKTAKLGSKLRSVITSQVARILKIVPQDIALSLAPVLEKYKVKALEQFTGYIEDISSGDSSNVAEDNDVLDAMTALMTILPWNDVIQAAHSLASLPVKILVKKRNLTPQGEFLLRVLKHIISTMETDVLVIRNITNNLSLLSVSRLCIIANKSAITDLDNVLFDLVRLCPHYAIATNEAHFRQCLESPPEGSPHKMAAIMVTHSEACRRWFRSYWSGLSEEERTSVKWQYVDIVLQYVRSLVLDGDAGGKEVRQIRNTYWDGLFEWIQSEDESADKDRLLTILTDTLDDYKLLESSWTEFLAFVVGASRLTVGHVHYMLTLCEAVQRAGSALPVWDVCVGSCLTALTNLLTIKLRGQNKVVVLEVLTALHKALDNASGETEALADVVKPVWSQVIKTGLKNLYMDEQMLRVLARLLPAVYSMESPVIPLGTLYEMVMSHSQFLRVMLQEKPTPVKDALVELLLMMAKQNPKACCQSSSHVTALLGAYNASLSKADQRLLLLMSLYESTGCLLEEHKPFLWGPKGIKYHQVKKSLGSSLWNRATSQQVMEALDTERLARSCLHFPLQRKLRPDCVVSPESVSSCEDVYDPCFLLSLFSHLLQPGHIVDCFEFVQSGSLGYVLSALSSHDNQLRGAAYHALAEFYQHVEGSRFPAKDQVYYLLQVVKNSVAESNTKLAPVVTTFLTRATKLMVTPDAPLYSAVNEFLLLKPAMDILNVPEFYKLFNSSALEFKSDRSWMLSLLVDGLRETADYRIFEKRYTFKIILAFYDSALSDAHTQRQVLNVVLQAVQQRTVAALLVKQHGLLAWINVAIATSAKDDEKLSLLVRVTDTLWQTTLASRESEKNDKETKVKSRYVPFAFTNEILHVLLHLLHTMRDHEDLETFSTLLGCLFSVLTHLKTTIAAMGCTVPPFHVQIKATDILELIERYSCLTQADGRKWEVRSLLSSLGLSQTEPSYGEKRNKQAQQHGRRIKGTDTKLAQSERKDNSEVHKSCIRRILEVITHWTPAAGMQGKPSSAAPCGTDIANVAATLYIASWGLEQIHSHFAGDLQLTYEVLRWLCSWMLEPTCSAHRTTMTSDTESSRRLVGQLLTMYGLCTKSITATTKAKISQKGLGQVKDLQLVNLIKVNTTEILAAVIDSCLQEGSNGGGCRLGQALQKGDFKKARDLLTTVKGNHNALCLFIQELWLDATTPSHFTTLVQDTLQNKV